MQSHGGPELVAELPQSLKNQQRTERLIQIEWSRAMSALGHEQTSLNVRVMSVLPLKADIR
jgi:hypothetical protein